MSRFNYLKMFKYAVTILISVFSLGCKKSEVPAPPDNSSSTSNTVITVDLNTTYQEMDGFGASDAWRCQFVGKNWPLDKREKIADLLFSQQLDQDGNPRGIGLSMWRFNIGTGSAEQGSNSYIANEWRRSECFLNADGSYDWTKQEGQQWFLQAAKKRGVEKVIGFVNSPPVYYTQNGKAFSPGGWHWNLKSGYVNKYADFLATVAAHFQSIDLPFNYISPVNEPQWDWTAGSNGWAGQEGTPAANNEIATLTKELSSQLAQRGLNTKVAVAEAGELNYLYDTSDADRGNQIDDFFNPSSSDYIGGSSNVEKVISGHSYFTVWPVSDMASVRSAVYAKMLATNSNLKYWMSEYCILEASNSDMNGGPTRDLTMKTALYVARIIHYDLTVGRASSWQWWTALTRGDYKDGLIYLDDGTNNGGGGADQPNYCRNDGYIRQSKLMWALGNFSFFIRPGMIRVMGSAPQSIPNPQYGLFTSAYKDETNRKVVIVAINYSDTSRDVSIDLKGGQWTGNQLDSYETSDADNLKHSGSPSPSQITIPPNSIVTLTGNYQ